MDITKTKLLKILALPSRMKILEVIFEKEETNVTTIMEETGIEQTLLSHQLAVLKKYKIVISRVNGKQRLYSLNQKTMIEIMILLDEHMKLFGKNAR